VLAPDGNALAVNQWWFDAMSEKQLLTNGSDT
jgi:hypothetical protein